MNFEQAIQLVADSKITHIKVLDAEGKRMLDLNSEAPDGLILQLEGYRQLLSAYGRVKFQAATESMFKQNWKDCFNWTIVFNNAAPGSAAPAQIGGLPSGYISANEALLMQQVEGLKREAAFNQKLDEITKKLDSSKGFSFDKIIPFLGMLVDLDEKKLNTMLQLAQINGLSNGTFKPAAHAGIAGLQEKKADVQTTDDEKKIIDAVNDEMGKLSEKVELSSILEFIKTLNEKPELLNTLIGMAKNFK